jgi:hypothetical protein
MAEATPPIPWRDHPARELLLAALKAGSILPDEKPRTVYDKYKEHPSFVGIEYDNAFTRRLRALKKKAASDDEDNKIDWENHPAKKFLFDSFAAGTISVGYSDTIGPKGVWDQVCKDNQVFKDVQYDEAFTRRLKAVEKYYDKKLKRAQDDQKAFDIFRANHPIKTEGRWAGSEAQRLLKQDMAEGRHLAYAGKPQEFRNLPDRPQYREFSKQKFRDHISQEKRLVKFNNYMEKLKTDKEKKGKK